MLDSDERREEIECRKKGVKERRLGTSQTRRQDGDIRTNVQSKKSPIWHLGEDLIRQEVASMKDLEWIVQGAAQKLVWLGQAREKEDSRRWGQAGSSTRYAIEGLWLMS